MKFSWKWLCSYLDPISNAQDLIESTLLQAGIETEQIIYNPEGFEIVTIESISKHPNADTLNICKLKDKNLTIVCGASNVRVGMRCILANIGAIIPNTNKVLQKSSIRGIESEGMLCSAEELLLNSDIKDGILDLRQDAVLKELLMPNGPIFDVAITPNRGDLLSVYGIARELAAFGLGSLKSPNLHSLQLNFEPGNSLLKIEDECVKSMYGASLNEIYHNKSPAWLMKCLGEVGINSYCAVVDVTNYISHSLGQPLHAFDLDIVSQIEVKKSSCKNFKDLKGKAHDIQDLPVMLSDGKCVCIPGVIGGDYGKCSQNTKNVLVEAGNYSADYIYNAQKASCTTDASRKFFHGVDANMTKIALTEACAMIQDICACSFGKAEVAKEYIPEEKKYLSFNSSIIGSNIDNETASGALKALGFVNTGKYVAPSWRHDVVSDEDLVEEVLRYVGYNSIPEVAPKAFFQKVSTISDEIKLRSFLVANGLYEVITKDFMSKEMDVIFKQDKELYLSNPMTKAQFTVRNTIMSGLIEVCETYGRYNWQTKGIFEIGSVFNKDGQSNALAMAIFKGDMYNWSSSKANFEYFRAKEMFERTIHLLYNNKLKCASYNDRVLENCCVWTIGEVVIAKFGELSKDLVKSLKIKKNFYLGEVYLAKQDNHKEDRVISSYEVVTRDLSLYVPRDVYFEDILHKLTESISKAIKIKIFDVYPDALLTNTERSVGIRLIWDNLEATLTSDEINKILSIAEDVAVKLGCKVKQS